MPRTNSIGAYGRSGNNEIGAYQKFVVASTRSASPVANDIGAYITEGADIGAWQDDQAATGLTVEMTLATLTTSALAKTVLTHRSVTQGAVATLSATPYGGMVGYPIAVEMGLSTLTASTSSMPNNYDRGVNLAAASLSTTTPQMTTTLTLRRIVNMTLATLSITKYKLGTMYDLGERRVRKTLAITAKLLRNLARELTNGT